MALIIETDEGDVVWDGFAEKAKAQELSQTPSPENSKHAFFMRLAQKSAIWDANPWPDWISKDMTINDGHWSYSAMEIYRMVLASLYLHNTSLNQGMGICYTGYPEKDLSADDYFDGWRAVFVGANSREINYAIFVKDTKIAFYSDRYLTMIGLRPEEFAYAATYFARPAAKPAPRVNLLVSGPEGLGACEIEIEPETFLSDNYYPDIGEKFVRMTEDCTTKKPRGRIGVISGPPGTGKCLGLGTPVLKYDGSVVPVESIVAGDSLMGPDSKPRKVLSTVRGIGELYQINPVKGSPWVCNDVHVLTLKNTHTKEIVDIPLNEYLQKSTYWKNSHKQFSVGVDFPVNDDLLVDPYLIGLWAGDGSKELSNNGLYLKRIGITTADPEIVEYLKDIATRVGCSLSKHEDPRALSDTYLFAKLKGDGKVGPFLATFRKEVGTNSVIPEKYLRSSRHNRLQLLAGILDSDGHLNNGGFEISQKNMTMASQIAFLARSLGLKVVSTKTQKTCQNGFVGMYVRMSISGDCSIIPTKIARKRAPSRRQIKDALNTGISVEPIGIGEYAGFELDGDGRFLLGDFTVTHNTHLIMALINEIRNKADVLLMPSSMVSSIVDPTLVNTLLNFRDKNKPMVLVIEDADEAIRKRKGAGDSALSALLNLSDGLFGQILDTRIICTTNIDQNDVDPAIYRPGRLSSYVYVGPLDKEQSQRVYERLGGKEVLTEKEYTLAQIYAMASGTEPSQTTVSKAPIGFTR